MISAERLQPVQTRVCISVQRSAASTGRRLLDRLRSRCWFVPEADRNHLLLTAFNRLVARFTCPPPKRADLPRAPSPPRLARGFFFRAYGTARCNPAGLSGRRSRRLRAIRYLRVKEPALPPQSGSAVHAELFSTRRAHRGRRDIAPRTFRRRCNREGAHTGSKRRRKRDPAASAAALTPSPVAR